MSKQKGAAKVGKNKRSPSMMAYKLNGRMLKNKRRNIQTEENWQAKRRNKRVNRIMAGLPVHHRNRPGDPKYSKSLYSAF